MSFAVYCTSRTGSTWLCDMLSQTGRFGLPGEHFNPEGLAWKKKELGLPESCGADKYWQRLTESYGENLVVKCGWPIAPYVRELIQPQASVFLTRENKVKQAISLYRANQTQNWGDEPLEECEIDAGSILQQLTSIVVAEKAILDWIRETGQQTTTFSYEELCRDPVGVLCDIAEEFGRPIERRHAEHFAEVRTRSDPWSQRAQNLIDSVLYGGD